MSGGASDDIRRLVASGELLEAYDKAMEALGEHPDDVETQYLAVLALARSGATDRALEAFRGFGLGAVHAEGRLAEDIPALEARVAKDRALTATGGIRSVRAADAAEAYEAIYRRVEGAYTCINAATMWLVAGDPARSRALAEKALELCRRDRDRGEDDPWTAATEAEAALLLHDPDAAMDALERFAAATAGQYASRASARRQLELICQITGLDRTALDALANPPVIHYVGHRISPEGATGRFPAANEGRVAAAIRDHLDDRSVGFGYGSLASGADILVAEALIDRGAELHVVLPFRRDEFVAVSVADGGPMWIERFERCLAAADSVTLATEGEFLGDPMLFDFCAQVAMGDAIMRSQALLADVEQVAVWDGRRPARGAVGTAVDVERWRAMGNELTVIDSGPTGDAPTDESPPQTRARVVRAMLFADIAGFSKLGDREIPVFMEDVMGPLAETIESFGDDVLLRHTWGDGLYLVLRDATTAAACALAMQATVRGIDLDALGLPQLRGMRVGGHVGPVFEGWDRVRRETNYFGANVTRAARIEPRTPEGEVYVTHPFAALVALDADQALTCEYVGHVPTAKDYGVLPMYVVKRRS